MRHLTTQRIANRFAKMLADIFPKWSNTTLCSDMRLWDFYFDHSEGDVIESQWKDMIWPVIKELDFDTVLELAPGAGRNTARLVEISNVIHAVDMNQSALDRLERRFRRYAGPCRLHFYRNDGSSLPMIQANSITAIYCWDSAVHFAPPVIQEYVSEFARVLKAGGKGFVHHSNLGSSAGSDFRRNPQYRSNMSKDLFRKYCDDNRLSIIQQIDLPWGAADNPSGQVVDCISVFSK